jgi:hypothetical protein
MLGLDLCFLNVVQTNAFDQVYKSDVLLLCCI